MHGPLNVKFVNAQQAKQTYQYNNTKQKLYKTNAAVWYNNICRHFHPDVASRRQHNLLLSTVLQLLVQSFVLLNQFFASSSTLDKSLPIWHFQLLYIFFNIILPAYLWSSLWPLWNGFPGVYCFDHSCFLHSFDMIIPSLPLRSGEVYYVPIPD